MRVDNPVVFFIGSFFCLFVSVWNSIEAQSANVPERPNILWIIVEDMSPDLGYLGHELVKTPHIDALASRGMQLTHVFTTGVACSPSRTALVTGYYQNYIGAHHMRYPDELKPALPDTISPVHVRLHDIGYQTANIRSFPGNGKTDWLFSYDAHSYDFSHWEEIDPDLPFFARINLRLTHRPFTNDEQNPVNPHHVKVPPYYPDHIVAQKDFAAYYESIQVMDGQIGQIISDLKKYHLEDNTIIFFFSDHGRPMPRAKNFLYDSGVNVPLVIASLDEEWRTALNLKGRNESLFSLIDVTATTLDITGIDDVRTQGRSILQNPQGREYVWGAADRIGEIYFRSRMIRTKEFKFIRNYRHDLSINEASTAHRKGRYPIYHLLNILHDKGELDPAQKKLVEPMVPVELYRVTSDPYEIINLAEDPKYQEVLKGLNRRLENFSQGIDDQGMKEDPEIIARAFDNYGKSSLELNKMRILELREQVENSVK